MSRTSPFYFTDDAIALLNLFWDKFRDETLGEFQFYIDGTMYDGGNLVLSCRGVSDTEMNFEYLDSKRMSEISEDLENATVFTEYYSFEHQKSSFPHNARIWVDNDVLEQIEDDPDLDAITLKVLSLYGDQPMFFAELISIGHLPNSFCA